jgi:hypothetical protein
MVTTSRATGHPAGMFSDRGTGLAERHAGISMMPGSNTSTISRDPVAQQRIATIVAQRMVTTRSRLPNCCWY